MARVAKKIASAHITRASHWRSGETPLSQKGTFPPRNILHLLVILRSDPRRGQSLKTGHNYAYQEAWSAGLSAVRRWLYCRHLKVVAWSERWAEARKRASRFDVEKRCGPVKRVRSGGVAEWLKAHVWKACLRETVTWVRIPLPPPSHWLKQLNIWGNIYIKISMP